MIIAVLVEQLLRLHTVNELCLQFATVIYDESKSTQFSGSLLLQCHALETV